MQKRDQKPYLLTVLTGPNAGAQVPLGGRQVRVGTRADDDIQLDLLAGDGVALAFGRDRVRVRPGADPVDTGAGQTCPAGTATVLRLPATLVLDAETRIHLCRTSPARSGVLAAFGAGFALAAAGLGVVGAAALTAPDLPPRAEVAPARTVAEAAPARTRTPAPAAPPAATPPSASALAGEAAVQRAEAAAETLRAAAAEAGLDGLEIASDGEVVRITGTYGRHQADAWHRLRQGHDRVHGARVALLADVAEVSLEPPFDVASVWLGERPEIVTRDGMTLRPGDRVRDGWTVDEIAEGRVRVTRGRQSIDIAF